MSIYQLLETGDRPAGAPTVRPPRLPLQRRAAAPPQVAFVAGLVSWFVWWLGTGAQHIRFSLFLTNKAILSIVFNSGEENAKLGSGGWPTFLPLIRILAA